MAHTEISIPKSFGQVSAKFLAAKMDNDLAAGVVSGFGIISYRGKVWRTKYRGEERDLMRADGDGPRSSIEVVVVKGAANLSKIFYEQGYVEGSTAAPDCWSSNGVTPDAACTKKQSNACASCKQNAFGSRITPAGKQGKACSDSKRLAIVPLEDIDNDVLGGPMLLRVPAASLGDLATFGTKMQGMGYPYNSIGIRIAFDTKEAYPKFVFSAIRPLTDEEAEKVLAYQSDPRVARILNESSEYAAEPTGPSLADVFEQPPQTAAKPVPAHDPETGEIKAPKPAPKKAAPAPEPGFSMEMPSSIDSELDVALNELICRATAVEVDLRPHRHPRGCNREQRARVSGRSSF